MAETASLPVIHRGEMTAEEKDIFYKFVSPPNWGGENPDPQPATVVVRRDLLETLDLDLPDGAKVRMWVIGDPDDSDNGRVFPAKTIRVPRGAMVKAEVNCKGGTHTIHWHGIEPTPMNDGVGKHSFEVSGNFPYQFQPREAGTFFYHCHKNTPLHFELGLYGLLIVDPPDPALPDVPATYPDGGPGFASCYNPLALLPEEHAVRYDAEAFWVIDDIDTRWHELGHDAFMQICDPDDPVNPSGFSQDGFLNDIRPDIVSLTGVLRRVGDPTPYTPGNSPALVAPTVAVGQTLLIRTTNAAYATASFVFDHPVEVIAMDGHALGVPPFQQYSRPFIVPAGRAFELSSAMRRDLLIKPLIATDIHASIELLHSVTGSRIYIAGVTIAVTA